VTRTVGTDERPGEADASALLGSFLTLMADRTRRLVFVRLMAGEACNGDIAKGLSVSQNLVSHHLRQLRQSGLVRARRAADDRRWIYYSVDRDALVQVHRELGALFDPDRLGVKGL
jgi:ArsR family transcriptional regulator